jgi:putative effector of murein hydrolase
MLNTFAALARNRGVVDRHVRVVTVEVRELVGLVVDQDQHRVFGPKQRRKSITKGVDAGLGGHAIGFLTVQEIGRTEKAWFALTSSLDNDGEE